MNDGDSVSGHSLGSLPPDWPVAGKTKHSSLLRCLKSGQRAKNHLASGLTHFPEPAKAPSSGAKAEGETVATASPVYVGA